MDFVSALVLFVILFLLFSLCGFCCRSKRRGTIFSTPVVVTSATHTAPGMYPTGVQSVSVYPTSATNYQPGVYPQQAPYPVSGGMPMPMPMSQPQMNPPQAGMNQHMMPPYPTAGPGMNPPSYDSAVGTGANANASNPAYEKQMPYNPNYATGYQ